MQKNVKDSMFWCLNMQNAFRTTNFFVFLLALGKLFAENSRIIFKKRGFILEMPYKIIEKQRKIP